MKDELIKFETAKLAKEKGFQLDKYLSIDSENPRNLNSNYNPKDYQPWYFDLTQSLLQKWLREVHDIHISIEVEENRDKTNRYKGTNFSNLIEEEIDSDIWFNTYEEALEDTLVDCLNLIKL